MSHDSLARSASQYGRRHRQPLYLLMSLGVTACATLTPHMNAQLPLGVDTSAVSVLPTSTAGDLSSPTATRADDGWVVAANLLPGGLDARFARRAFYLVHSLKGPLPMPDGDFLFMQPVVQFSGDGTLHLFWAEGSGRESAEGWPLTKTALWHASYVRDQWTSPERLLLGKWLYWEPRSSQVVTDDRGQLHLMVTAADTGMHGEHTYHLTQRASGWEKRDTGLHAHQIALTTLPGGRFVMAYVDGEPAGGASNQLYTVSSADEGTSWSPAVRVLALTDKAEVNWPQLRSVGDTMYLSWFGDAGSTETIWSLSQSTYSRGNLAASWSPPLRAALPGIVLSVTTAATGCGTVLAFAEMITPERRLMVHRLTVRDSRVTVEPSFTALAPLMERSRDRIIALWNAPNIPRRLLEPRFREFGTCP